MEDGPIDLETIDLSTAIEDKDIPTITSILSKWHFSSNTPNLLAQRNKFIERFYAMHNHTIKEVALRSGDIEVVKCVLENGVRGGGGVGLWEKRFPTFYGIIHAIITSFPPENFSTVLDLLISHGYNVNHRFNSEEPQNNIATWCPLIQALNHWNRSDHYAKMCLVLLSKGARLNNLTYLKLPKEEGYRQTTVGRLIWIILNSSLKGIVPHTQDYLSLLHEVSGFSMDDNNK